jgi:hypothetical protein
VALHIQQTPVIFSTEEVEKFATTHTVRGTAAVLKASVRIQRIDTLAAVSKSGQRGIS